MVRAARVGRRDRVPAHRPVHHAEPGVSRIRARAAAIALLAFFGGVHGARQPESGLAPPIPVAFAPNRGQWDEAIDFSARASAATVALTTGGARIVTRGRESVSMGLVGANPAARPTGLAQLRGTASFFVGRDRSRWRAGVPTYAAVRYERVYPGIDLTWHGGGGSVEYDFAIAPGADPARIRLRFGGAKALAVDRRGDLVLTLPDEEIRHLRPVAYQSRGSAREPVDVAWSLDEAQGAGFSVGRYDPERALIIDPVIAGSAVIGGGSFDSANAVAVDSAGNVFLAGDTASADFPAPPGWRGGNDVFVAKLDASARVLLSSTFLGGAESDTAGGIAVDGNGDVWVAGETLSSDFPATSAAFQEQLAGASDAFVARLDPSGVLLEWATYLGGEGFDRANAVAASGAGAAVAGRTGSMAFPTTPGAFQTFFRGSDFDAFVTRFDLAGEVTSSSFLGGSENDAAFGAAFGPAESLSVVGGTRSPDFPATANAYQGSNFSTDAFVTKFSATDALLYSTFLGGSFIERGNAIDADGAGRLVVAGWTSSPDFPSAAATQPAYGGGAFDAFVAVLDPARAGDASLLFASFLGGSGDDRAHGSAFGPHDSAQVVGQTSSTNFPVVDPGQFGSGGGDNETFAFALDLAGTPRIRYSIVAGGAGDDRAHAVAIGPSGDALVAGRTDSAGFPPGASRIGPAGGTDAFVARLAEGQGILPAVPALSPVGATAMALMLVLVGFYLARRS